MARVTDQGISGLVGPVVFYTVNGKNFVKGKPHPRKKKRNQPANPLNTIFGMVSCYGSKMISSIRTSFLFSFNRNTYNRLRGWMRNQYAVHGEEEVWELSAIDSGMCQVNEGIDLRDFLKRDITVEDAGGGKIIISLPELNPVKNIQAPLHTKEVNLKMLVVTSKFRDETSSTTKLCTLQYSFSYTNVLQVAKNFELQTTGLAGDMALIVVALEFNKTSGMDDTHYILDPQLLPAAIIAMGRLKE
jgi:hypothetical protein